MRGDGGGSGDSGVWLLRHTRSLVAAAAFEHPHAPITTSIGSSARPIELGLVVVGVVVVIVTVASRATDPKATTPADRSTSTNREARFVRRVASWDEERRAIEGHKKRPVHTKS